MKSSRKIYVFYQIAGWIVLWVFLFYQANTSRVSGRVSWAVLIIALPVGVLLAYLRWKYWLPVLDDVRARRRARRKQRGESPPMNRA